VNKLSIIIEAIQNNYQVTSVSPTDSIAFRADDSLFTIRINFTSSSKTSDVFCDIIASDQSKLNSSSFQLFDNGDPSNGDATSGDNRFANKFPLSEFYPNGIYNIKYYVKNADETLQRVAVGSFKYNNGQNNEPPEIANTVVDPDTVVVTQPATISQNTSLVLLEEVKLILIVNNESSARNAILSVGLTDVT